jgi:hypothetical protein
MGEVVLEVATEAHVALVAARMRQDDAAEVLASGGYTPAEALRSSLTRSAFARTAMLNGEALCMFGVVEVGEDVAIPWLLTTDLVEQHPMAFWRASKLVIARLRQVYPFLIQAIDSRYTRALSWAQRLGFAVEEARPFGAAGLPFCTITMGG